MFGGGGFGTQQPAFGASTAPAAGFGTFGTGAFGAPSQPAFGAAASAPAFGAASTPAFGASPAGFGAASTPAFGAASAPAFGAANAFGGAASAFGAPKPAGAFGSSFGGTFGAASQPAFGTTGLTPSFGQPSAPAFGAASAPAFGAATGTMFGAASTPAFGTPQAASPFGGTTSTFGAASQPAFGATTGGLFGASAPAASPFGAAPASGGLFGQQAAAQQPGFGAAAATAAGSGSRVVPYQKTVERDGTNAAGAANAANYYSINAMQAYINKSFEELRWEDYQAGVKQGAAPAPTPANPFGSPAGAASPFGLPAPSSAPAFGTATPASTFGTPSSAPAFGTSLFGAQSAAAPAFGSTAPAFGAAPAANPFGAASTPGFGAASTPAFGSAFGAASASAFGAARPASTPGFSFSTSPSLFGQSSAASAFGAASAPSLFSTGSAPAAGGTGLFGATQGSPFGTSFATPQAASSPFGGTSAFGAAKPATGFGTPGLFGASTGGAFGSTSPSMFGQTAGGLFSGSTFAGGTGTTPSLFASSTPSLFGGASAPSLFGGATAPATGGLFGQAAPGGFSLQPFGAASAAAPGAVAAAPPSVSAAPYGAFPSLPTVPEPRVGISARPARATASVTGAGALRASPLVSLRATASGSTNKLGAAPQVPSRPGSISPLGSLGVVVSDAAATTSAGTTPAAGSVTPGSALRARANPHQLFIREMPPSTQPSTGAGAFSPSRRTPSPGPSSRGGTPYQAAANGGGGLASPFNPFTPASAGRGNRDQSDGGGFGPGADAGDADGGAGPGNGHAADGGQHDSTWGAGGGRGADGTPSRRGGREGVEDYSFLPQLGKLASEGYYYEPSAAQLQAMHQTDPDSLAKVSNFTVGCEGKGSVRWLKPVDVRGLKLEGIIKIQQGEVYCYAQGDKPPVGQGLNTDSEITLLNVYKTDKATGQQVRDGPALIKWEKRLRTMCASMDAKFVSYKVAGGVWKFEVEHFSRYGLLPEDSDEEDGETAMVTAGAGPSTSTPHRGFGLSAMDDDAHDNGDHHQASETTAIAGFGAEGEADEEEGLSGLMEEEDVGAMGSPGLDYEQDLGDAAAAAAAVPLQHSLPAHLALEPSHLMMLRDTYFAPSVHDMAPPPSSQLVPYGAPSQPPTSSTALSLPAPAQYAGGAFMLHQARAGPSLQATSAAAAAGSAAGAHSRPHAWRAVPPAITTSKPSKAAAAAGAGAAGARQDGAGSSADALALVPTGGEGTVYRPIAGAAGLLGSGGRGEGAPHLMDAGLSLGLSFRVGWGPDGSLVIPGPPGLKLASAAQPVVVSRVLVEGPGSSKGNSSDAMDTGATEGGAPPRLLALREQLRGLLEVHLRHSSPTATTLTAPVTPPPASASAAEGVADADNSSVLGGSSSRGSAWLPQWKLQCSCEELPGLVSELVAAVQGSDAGDATEREHAVETWRLLQVLFEAEPVGAGTALPETSADGQLGLGDMDATTPRAQIAGPSGGGALGGPQPQDSQFEVAVQRQSNISRWLQQQVLPAVRAALPAAASPCDALLQLLAAHHLAGAVALAAATGDVRLATLLATGGLHAGVQADAARQLQTWDQNHMTAAISPARLMVYQLLAGQVEFALSALALDWRGALGLLLWYQAAQPIVAQQGSSATPQLPERNQPGHTAQAITSYTDMLAAGTLVPHPLPPYAQGVTSARHPSVLHRPTDLQFVVLQVWAARENALAQAAAEQQEQLLQTPVAGGGDVTMGGSAPLASPLQPPATVAQMVPAQLLATSGHSSNPCAAAQPWCLLSVLQGLGVLQHVSDEHLQQLPWGEGAVSELVSEQEELEVQLTAFTGLISELLMAGDLCEWAVYVALHLPDAAPSGPATAFGYGAAARYGLGVCRNQVVREVLRRTAPQWVGCDWREAFFAETLRIPQVVLQAVKADWAAAHGDWEGACHCHLAAQQWQAAHQLLVEHVAPTLLLGNRTAQLLPLLQELQPHAHACSSWETGGGMYLQYLLAVAPPPGQPAAATQPVTVLQALTDRIAAARARLVAGIAPTALVGTPPMPSSQHVAAVGTSSNARATGQVLALPASATTMGSNSSSGGFRAGFGGAGDVAHSQQQQLVALEVMGRGVRAALLPALAAELHQAPRQAAAGAHAGRKAGALVDLVALLGPCSAQSATRTSAVGVAAHLLAGELLSVRQ